MKNTKQEKEEALKKKFEELKRQHAEEEPDQDDQEAPDTGVIPDRQFKKNLGCG